MQLQIGVKVLIKNSKGLYLLVQRTDTLSNNQEHAWDIPGGRINPEEDLRSALTREVNEEIGIKLTDAPKLIDAQDIFVTTKDLHVVRLTYTIDMDVSDIILSQEHQAHTWTSLEDAFQLNVDPYLKKILSKLL
ncbi:MAG: NUDIX domain-containing protein [Candidatus Saccharimonadales bacterium]